MHQVINVVVEAHEMEEAVSVAQGFFNNHLHHQHGGPFDYCTPMVEGHTVSGADRWIDYQNKDVAFPITSDPGRAEIEDAWNLTLDRIKENVEPAWESMQNVGSIDEFIEILLNEEDLIRHKLNKATSYDSVDYYLYVQGWSTGGIRSYRGWEYVQELIEEEEEHEENRRWVVPLDVHY